MGKVVSLEELRTLREQAKERGLRFVFTNGCFDILHRGHIELLKAAKGLGEILVVAINSDSSVRKIKGERRPIVNQTDRAVLLASLEFVNYVTIFDEETPAEIISSLLPDVLVKGSDYELEQIVGKREVEESGGKVVRVDILAGYSTEELLREIASRYANLNGEG